MSQAKKKNTRNPGKQPEPAAEQDQPAASKRHRGRKRSPSEQTVPRRRGEMAKPTPTEQGQPRILVYALVAVSVFLGLYLYAYALPQLQYFADGLSMPDARLGGFDVADIAALQAAFEDEATGQLSFVHVTAGVLFPLAVAAATWAALGLLARGGWRWWVIGFAAIFAVVDIIQNILIDQALAQIPPDPGLTMAASALTTTSWVMLAALGIIVAAVLITDAVRKPRR